MWEAGFFSLAFERAKGMPCIALVAAGWSHCAAIDTEGGLWVCEVQSMISLGRVLFPNEWKDSLHLSRWLAA